jgi:hypothetical protein
MAPRPGDDGARRGRSGGKAELLHAVYERITVAGPTITSARLTPSADAPGPTAASLQMTGEVSREGGPPYLAGATAPEMSTTIATLITTASRE